MENIELKRCPFCNTKPEIIYHYIKGTANRKHCFVRCPECKFRPTKYGYTYRKENFEKAMNNWNKSVDEVLPEIKGGIEVKEARQVKFTSLTNGEVIEGRLVRKIELGYLGIHFGYEVELVTGEVILVRDSFYKIEIRR